MSKMHLIRELQREIDRLVEEDEFAGAVLVAREGEVLFEGAWGMAHEGYGVPNRIDTKFNLASMNKMFTGVAVAQLVEEGELGFGDPISKFLPEYPREVAEKVTVHHLLTHTSGMGSYWNERFFASWAELRTVDDYIALFCDDPLAYEPGEAFLYSNAGFVVLGAIIERVVGRDYFSYVRRRIYEPAGMYETEAYEMDYSIPNLALGYTRQTAMGKESGGPRRNNLLYHVVKGGPAGGGYSTVGDMYRFGEALRSHCLLSEEMTSTVFAGRIERPDKPGVMYGYGWQNVTVDGQQVVGHSGGAPGVSGHFDLYLDLGYTVVVLANYDPPIAPRVAVMLRERLF